VLIYSQSHSRGSSVVSLFAACAIVFVAAGRPRPLVGAMGATTHTTHHAKANDRQRATLTRMGDAPNKRRRSQQRRGMEQRRSRRNEKEGRERACEKAGQTQAQRKSAQQPSANQLRRDQPHAHPSRHCDPAAPPYFPCVPLRPCKHQPMLPRSQRLLCPPAVVHSNVAALADRACST